MGWTGLQRNKGTDDAAFFQHYLFPTGGQRILTSSTVDGTFYAAVEDLAPGLQGDPGEVWALVILMQWSDETFNFTFKEMSENVLPGAAEAPAKVLNMLTPTSNESALVWRQWCRQAIERKARASRALRALRDGDQVTLAQPLRFTDGAVRDTFTVRVGLDRSGRRKLALTDGTHEYRVPGWRSMLASTARGGERTTVMDA